MVSLQLRLQHLLPNIEADSCAAQILVPHGIGSPFDIAGITEAQRDRAREVVGFETNGSSLLGSDAAISSQVTAARPTRSATLLASQFHVTNNAAFGP